MTKELVDPTTRPQILIGLPLMAALFYCAFVGVGKGAFGIVALATATGAWATRPKTALHKTFDILGARGFRVSKKTPTADMTAWLAGHWPTATAPSSEGRGLRVFAEGTFDGQPLVLFGAYETTPQASLRGELWLPTRARTAEELRALATAPALVTLRRDGFDVTLDAHGVRVVDPAGYERLIAQLVPVLRLTATLM